MSRRVALVGVFVLGLATIGRADIAPRWSDSSLARFSELILTGRVVRVASGWDREVNSLYTYVTIDVADVFKGWIPESQITLKQLGGTIDDIAFDVPGQPTFSEGEVALLFLEVRPRDSTLYTAAMWQGKWDIGLDRVSGQQLASRARPGDRGQSTGSAKDVRFLSSFASQLRALGNSSGGLRLSRPIQARPPETPIGAAGTVSAAFKLVGPARWNEVDNGAAIPIDVQNGGNSNLGGGIAQISNASGLWNGAGSKFRFGGGNLRGPRCWHSFEGNHRVSLTFNDPCGEIDEGGGELAVTGIWSTSSGGKTINGTLFNVITQAAVVYGITSYMSNPGCFQDITTHELGHTVGLGHPANFGPIMYGTISNSCFSGPRGLASDDKAGIQFIYPNATSCSAPGAPVNLKATKSGNIITLSWSPPTSGGAATSFVLQAGSSSGASNLFDGGVGSTPKISFQVPNGIYFFRVKAKNACGTSGASNQVMVIVP